MKFEKWVVLTLFGLAMLFAFHQYAAYLFSQHGWKGMTAGDWGTWIGAIGAVGAMFGTIWIATTETRRRIASEEAQGVIVAAALAPRLEVLARELAAFETRMDFCDLRTGTHKTSREEAAHLLTIKFTAATTHELMALEVMPNNCAKKLAFAQARLVVVQSEVARYVEASKQRDQPLSTKAAQIWAELTRDLRARFEVIARQCTEAARTHATPPTQLELYGEGDDLDGWDI